MTRKRKSGEKGKAGAQKKGAQKRDGSTPSRTRSQSQTKGKHTSHPSPARSRGHGGHSTGTTEPEPLSKDAQTQTSPSGLENKKTQTETVSQTTQQTQTELNGNTETTEVSELSPEDGKIEVETGRSMSKGNERDGENDECVKRKKRKVSESREPTEETKERTTLSDCCREQQEEMETSRDGDKQKDADTKEKHSGGDSQKDQVKSGTEETKSYAAAAATVKTNESKEKINQTAVNQDSTMESKRVQRFVALCLC